MEWLGSVEPLISCKDNISQDMLVMSMASLLKMSMEKTLLESPQNALINATIRASMSIMYLIFYSRMISIPPATRTNLMALIKEKINLLPLLSLSLENWKKKSRLSIVVFRISIRGNQKVSMKSHLLIEFLFLDIWDIDLSSDLPSKQVKMS